MADGFDAKDFGAMSANAHHDYDSNAHANDTKNEGIDWALHQDPNYAAWRYASPDHGEFSYADPRAYTDPNTAAIYQMIQHGVGMSNAQAPHANFTDLAHAQTYGAPIAGSQAAQIAPQMMLGGAQLSTAQDQQYASAQASIANMLAAQAQGQGPSLAEITANQQSDAAIAQQMGMLGSQRGASNPAMAQRQAMMGAAQAQQTAAAQAMTGRAAEQLSAQQQLSGLLQGVRGQGQAMTQAQAQLDQQAGLANQALSGQVSQAQAQMAQQAGQYNAGQYNQFAAQAGLANQAAQNQFALQQGSLNQQTSLANQQAKLSQAQLNDQMYGQMIGATQGQNQQDMAAAQAYQQSVQQAQLAMQGINAGLSINDTNNAMGMAGAALSAAGTGVGIVAGSDRRIKKGIRPGEADVRAMLDDIDALEIFNMIQGGQ